LFRGVGVGVFCFFLFLFFFFLRRVPIGHPCITLNPTVHLSRPLFSSLRTPSTKILRPPPGEDWVSISSELCHHSLVSFFDWRPTDNCPKLAHTHFLFFFLFSSVFVTVLPRRSVSLLFFLPRCSLFSLMFPIHPHFRTKPSTKVGFLGGFKPEICWRKSLQVVWEDSLQPDPHRGLVWRVFSSFSRRILFGPVPEVIHPLPQFIPLLQLDSPSERFVL